MRVYLRNLVAVAASVAAAFAPMTARAQDEQEQPEQMRDRFVASLALMGGQPVGQFSDFVDFMLGAAGSLVFNVGSQRVLGVRLNLELQEFDRDTRALTFVDPLIQFDFDVTTVNTIVSVGAGPQISAPTGRIRPYAFGTVGFAYFVTSTSISFADQADTALTVASSTNFDEWTFAAEAGGGLLINVVRGRHPIFIDLSVTYRSTGHATYLPEGSIEQAPNGMVTVTPIESDTDQILYRIGVSIGFG